MPLVHFMSSDTGNQRRITDFETIPSMAVLRTYPNTRESIVRCDPLLLSEKKIGS